MSKYQAYSRRALKALLRSWLRRNARFLLVVAGCTVLFVIGITVTVRMTFPPSPVRPYVLGVLHAAAVGIVIHAMHSMFLAHERAAILHMRGAWGEENTRDELKRAKRKRIIWGWVDSINLQSGDIDHLVVTRRGGIIAIDSKWRSSEVTDHEVMRASAARVRTRSQALAHTLLRPERGSHRARASAFEVRPAVVIWGAAQHAVPDDAQLGDIRFIGGRRLVPWLAELDGQTIEKGPAHDLLRRLERFRESSWDASPTTRAAG